MNALVYNEPAAGGMWVLFAAGLAFVYWWAHLIGKAEDAGDFHRADYLKAGCFLPFVLFFLAETVGCCMDLIGQ